MLLATENSNADLWDEGINRFGLLGIRPGNAHFRHRIADFFFETRQECIETPNQRSPQQQVFCVRVNRGGCVVHLSGILSQAYVLTEYYECVHVHIQTRMCMHVHKHVRITHTIYTHTHSLHTHIHISIHIHT